ncbi:hypothetical protein [Pseudoxanthomonas mexicana]|uniref:hypothetical protein n=1 Tax=Pseudoxanthomonas mexicana TaxID=128785 RepID=UPI00398B65C4
MKIPGPSVLVAVLALSACRAPEPPPKDEPPKPQATAAQTQLRDTIQEPLDKARGVQDSVQAAVDRQRAEIDADTH